MSPFSLRCEARLSVLRGFRLLRSIELARQGIDDELLSARMEVAGLEEHDDLADGEWIPTTEEIEAARDEINAGWNDEERERRWRFETYTPVRLKRRYAEALRVRPTRSKDLKRSEINRRYREKHREEILAKERAKMQDPVYLAAKRERDRQTRERNQLAIKERRYRQKDKINEQNQAWRAEHREHANAQAATYRRAKKQREHYLGAVGCA